MINIAERLKEFHENEKNLMRNYNDRVLIVDGLNTFLRNFSVNPLLDDHGNHVGGYLGTIISISSYIRRYKPTRCIVALDGSRGSARRRKIYPEYKTGKKSKVNLNRMYENDTDAEEKSLKEQYILFYRYLQHLPVTVSIMDDIEADDAIAYFTSLCDNEVIIVSTDKDFLQLSTEKIKIFSPSKKILYDPETIYNEYGVYPWNYIFMKIINGDKSDNIPGIAGFGEKTILKRLPFLQTIEKVTIEMLYDKVYKKKDEKNLELIQENNQILDRNYELMRLDTPISLNYTSTLRQIFDSRPAKCNYGTVRLNVAKDNLYSNIQNIDDILRQYLHLNTFIGE